MKTLRVIVVSVLVSLAGFQLDQPVQAAPIDNGSFMSLWSIYSHCQATSDFAQLREDALTLTKAANHSLTEEGFIPVSYTHLRAHETPEHLVCRLLLEKKKKYM